MLFYFRKLTKVCINKRRDEQDKKPWNRFEKTKRQNFAMFRIDTVYNVHESVNTSCIPTTTAIDR